MKIRMLLVAMFLSLVALPCLACGIKGTVTRKDGSKADGTVTITTSWNSDRTVPRNGSYSLDLGSRACGQTIEVYADGDRVGSYRIPSGGYATVNISL